MKDVYHTNEQRLNKIRGLIEGIRQLQPDDAFLEGRIASLNELAGEAEGSVDALEFFLAERKALDRTE